MRNRRIFHGTLLAASLLASGCSDGEPGYDYAIPSQVCGVEVDPSSLKNVLPPGKEARVSGDEAVDFEHLICRVVVDKKPGLAISVLRGGGTEDLFPYWQKEIEGLGRVSPGGPVTSAGVGDNGAAALIDCLPKPGQPQEEIPGFPYTRLRLIVEVGRGEEKPDSTTDLRTSTEQFMRTYVPGLTATWCK
ncbi:hypothetical protein [Streptomyces sp. NPDC004435]|uniref:hypothetical protein n=1 Tax=Streptomyces sp. NPDC004435 TaxID=3364701 RepID=UPI0036C5974B